MDIFKLKPTDQDQFASLPEIAMDCQFAKAEGGMIFPAEFYVVIGCAVAIRLNQSIFAEPYQGFLDQRWLNPIISAPERLTEFERWLKTLTEAPPLANLSPGDSSQLFWGGMGPISPIHPLPPAPPRPASIYGHLPFAANTLPTTVIYRWESFPTSRRIDRSVNPPTIAQDTYAAPASEVPFAVTGFASVARFALPTLLPACFRYELQPVAGTRIECGASVPLYGQAGGGVEVKLAAKTNNRCAIADPVFLPPL
jgi:hypothetical protein